MAYNENLANQIRELLQDTPGVTEKAMFQGLCFLVDEKLCICTKNEELLCRIGERQAGIELESGQCRPMVNNGRVMEDFVFVEEAAFRQARQLQRWLQLCLDFNPEAKRAKKK